MANEVKKVKKRLKMSTYKEKLVKLKAILNRLRSILEDVSDYFILYFFRYYYMISVLNVIAVFKQTRI